MNAAEQVELGAALTAVLRQFEPEPIQIPIGLRERVALIAKHVRELQRTADTHRKNAAEAAAVFGCAPHDVEFHAKRFRTAFAKLIADHLPEREA